MCVNQLTGHRVLKRSEHDEKKTTSRIDGKMIVCNFERYVNDSDIRNLIPYIQNKILIICSNKTC